MSAFDETCKRLRNRPRTWLITGVAGFIGSHLLENLLALGQRIVGLDDFSTGSRANLDDVRERAGDATFVGNFTFIEGDIRDLGMCRRACEGVDYILHHAALGSVPRSIDDPLATHECNVTGTVNMLIAAREHKVSRFVYASSSAVYGDDPTLPKVEHATGKSLSPYATSKMMNEEYAEIFARCYGMQTVGLRYFNVFGPRQSPEGAYAAVIPRWADAMTRGESPVIYGDGETSRDFCPVMNIVQAAILAATIENESAINQSYNIAIGGRTTLNELFELIRREVERVHGRAISIKPTYADFRPGDVRHSHADISKAQRLLGYEPTVGVQEGLMSTVESFAKAASMHNP